MCNAHLMPGVTSLQWVEPFFLFFAFYPTALSIGKLKHFLNLTPYI